MPPKRRSAPEPPNAPGHRRSARAGSSNQKSRYFESDPDDDDDADADELGDDPADEQKVVSGKKRGRLAKKPAATRGRSTGKRAKIEHDYEDEDDDDNDDADDFKEDIIDKDDEDDDDDDDDSDEDEMPKVTIIPLIKMRDTGGVDYEEDRLHKNTMLFLKDLKANNNRDWLKCRLSICLVKHPYHSVR